MEYGIIIFLFPKKRKEKFYGCASIVIAILSKYPGALAWFLHPCHLQSVIGGGELVLLRISFLSPTKVFTMVVHLVFTKEITSLPLTLIYLQKAGFNPGQSSFVFAETCWSFWMLDTFSSPFHTPFGLFLGISFSMKNHDTSI